MSRFNANYPNQVSTLVELLRQRARNQPDKLAYTYLIDGEMEEARLTYEELDQRARAIGAQLQTLGVAGERVLLVYPSGLDYIAAFFGCLYAGAVAVPVYPPEPMRMERTLPRFLGIVKDSSPKVILTTSQISAGAQGITSQYPQLQDIYWLASDQIPDELSADWFSPEISAVTLAFLQYTSGSTAEPKGVMLTHGMLLSNGDMIQQAFEHTESSTFVGWAPLYHDLGLIGNVLQPLHIGARCILMSPLHFLQKPYRWLQAISRYQGRTSGGPNFGYDLCMRKVTPQQCEQLDLSSWEIAFNGAEPVHHQTLDKFCQTFASSGFRREAFYPCYGLAEASVFVSGGIKSEPPVVKSFSGSALDQYHVLETQLGDEDTRSLVGCGRSWLEEEIVIVDPHTSLSCPPDRIGEIWVSGPNIAQGYWCRPEETENIFNAYTANSGEGPFLRTGDLGFINDGQLFITGRIKDLIIIDGLNHYPQDIELTVEQSHPSLRPGCSAAFSVEFDGLEKLVVAVEIDVNRMSKAEQGISIITPGKSEVLRAIQRSISRNHDLRVQDIVLLNPRTIPKTSSGKIQRQACKASYLAGGLDVWKRED